MQELAQAGEILKSERVRTLAGGLFLVSWAGLGNFMIFMYSFSQFCLAYFPQCLSVVTFLLSVPLHIK